VNSITIMGRIGNEVELVKTASGTEVCKFSVATTEKVKGEAETTWHNVVSFGKTAEIIAQYFRKGSRILLSGKQSHNKYEKDGKTQYFAQILLRDFNFIDTKDEAPQQTQQGQQQQQPQQQGQGLPDDDELPF